MSIRKNMKCRFSRNHIKPATTLELFDVQALGPVREDTQMWCKFRDVL